MTKESHQWYQEVLAAKNGQIERLRAALERIEEISSKIETEKADEIWTIASAALDAHGAK